MPRSQHEDDLLTEARKVLPGGGFGNLSFDIVIREGKAALVWDESGNEYVDFLLGSGPMFLGHAHPDVTAAAVAQMAKGTTFFANNAEGIKLARVIVDAVACAEQVRFVSSGTEADAYAMRLARAFRKREKIMKFEGGYHGMSDWSLLSLAPRQPGNFPQASRDSAGIPRSVAADMLIAPFNDSEAATALIRAHADELAGVIVEPFQRLIPPAPGFLQALRDVTRECGVPLIFDEVVTGFRFAWGGAAEFYGVTPDICTLGKIIGGGFPLAAIAGRADIMKHFDKALVGADDFLPMIGTLSGNPVAAAAGLASLKVLGQPGVYEKVAATGRTLMEGMAKIVAEKGLPAQVIGVPVLFDVVYTKEEIRDYRSTAKADTAMQGRINARLREGGVLKGDTKFYVSVAHTEADVAHTLEAFRKAVMAE